MQRILRRKLAIAATALAVVAFAGGAFAATQESGANVHQTFLNDVAQRLKVSPAQLAAAMRGAVIDQLGAAVAAGRLTQAQADAIKQRILQDGATPRLGMPFFGAPGDLGPGLFGPPKIAGTHAGGPIGAAAKYIGLSEAKLVEGLSSGKSLAQIAVGAGKSVAGLKDAITTAERTRLQRALAAKLITTAQEQQILSGFAGRLDEIVNRKGLAPSARAPMPGLAGPPGGAPAY